MMNSKKTCKIKRLFALVLSIAMVLGCSTISYAATTTRTGNIVGVTVTSNGTYQSDSDVKSNIMRSAKFTATFNTDSSGAIVLGKPVSTKLSGLEVALDVISYSSYKYLDGGRTVAVTYNYKYVVPLTNQTAQAKVVVEYYK